MASAMIKIQKLKLGGKYNMTQLISRFDELIPYCKIQDNEPMKIHFFNQYNMPQNSAWPTIGSMLITGNDPDMELPETTIMKKKEQTSASQSFPPARSKNIKTKGNASIAANEDTCLDTAQTKRTTETKGNDPREEMETGEKGNLRSTETDDEPAKEEKEEGDIMRIRAMITNLSTEERSELLGKDFQ
ncbi:hypothetical protein M378DRAFT_18473 [Amanita muscaria Koide BX008]|uniref:Uncharacterized protein n=1 Tax=Amanita muscaria (strain Koide BX008) TaxID=946122 RepID=A0A0C2WFH5_AMAMK|nr:hypothetical protein M378DRAFT_18473 [Amanita muscaria Koide BX008]